MASPIEEIRQRVLAERALEAKSRSQPPPVVAPTTPPSGLSSGSLPPWMVSAQIPAAATHPAAAATMGGAASATISPTPATPSIAGPTPTASRVPVAESRGSSPPMSVPTFVRFFKLCITAAILLGGSYFAVKNAYPFLKELAEPGSTGAANSKDAPTSVKILQQTREVVAKNNANVDHLHRILDDPNGTLPEPPLRPLASSRELTGSLLPPLPPPPELPAARPKPQIRLERLAGVVLDDLHISGVRGGEEPRIMVDGVQVRLGGIVDTTRRLRFMSIDESRRVIVLGDEHETIEKSY